MNLQAIWDSRLDTELTTAEGNGEILQKILDMLSSYEQKAKDYFYQEEDFYSEEFTQWIYDKSNIMLNDLKRELLKKLEKCQIIERKDERWKFASNNSVDKENMLFFISLDEKPLLCACTSSKFYNIKREYLKMFSKSEFKDSYEECFPKIYFDDSVPSSLNTLKTDFNLIREEIVEHLACLDSFCPQFLDMRKDGKSNKEMAQAFKEYSKIDCSDQNNRKDVVVLEREYLNEIEQKMEKVCCELHTKFIKDGKDKTKQDRIYFAAAKEGIKEGRIIVIHIGRHIKNGKL